MSTKAVPVLYKFTQLPNIVPDAVVVGTGNIIIFTPKRPFKCSHILLWFSKHLIINQITIGWDKQLAIPHLPGSVLAAPVTLQLIENCFRASVLSMMLQEHHVHQLKLNTADPKRAIKIELEGSFDIMALYGTELTDE